MRELKCLRHFTSDNMLFSFENFALDCERRELRAHGAIVPVEPQVFDLLVY